MSLTELFFRLALGVSFTFSICFVILFVAYMINYHGVNNIFKAVNHD